MDIIENLFSQAAAANKKIVLPESDDARICNAVKEIHAHGLAEIIFIGARDKFNHSDIKLDINKIKFIDPNAASYKNKYMDIARDAYPKLSREDLTIEINKPLTAAACAVVAKDADGCIAGANHTTADVVRTAIKIIGARTDQQYPAAQIAQGLVSSFFIMSHPQPPLAPAAVFADCALVVEPSAEQLSRIALDAAANAQALLNLTPRVAMLSFSTAGSAKHPYVDKIRRAGELIARAQPDLELLCEVQFDAAIVPEILNTKAAHMKAAPANVFIFPDLQSANIGYKIAERVGGIRATGPILQGLARPMNDLSRGCCVSDIVAMTAITALQAHP